MGHLRWLRPDGKTQGTIEYAQKADDSEEPLRTHTVVILTQPACQQGWGFEVMY